MPAIPRSEPFREQACPLGVCDGSGWILGPEDVARPCECRERRMARRRPIAGSHESDDRAGADRREDEAQKPQDERPEPELEEAVDARGARFRRRSAPGRR